MNVLSHLFWVNESLSDWELRSKNCKYKSTSANELKLCCEAIGSMRRFICSHASKTAAPYISELAEAAVGEELGTWFCGEHEQNQKQYFQIQERITGRRDKGDNPNEPEKQFRIIISKNAVQDIIFKIFINRKVAKNLLSFFCLPGNQDL